MPILRPRPDRSAFYCELIFCLLIMFSIYKVGAFLLSAGYLPPPFFHDTNDTFMDWYNTVYWTHNRGAYDIWLTVYPPLSFDFLRLVSIGSCYWGDPLSSRGCDPVGVWVLVAFFSVNVWITYLCFRKNADPTTVWPRTIALSLGLPMLFALERGNLIIPCFTCFALGHGRLLKSARWKWLAVALTINFKPYLAIPLITQLFRRRWRWVEGAAVATVLVYLFTFIAEGDGTPQTVITNILKFAEPFDGVNLTPAEFSTSYTSIMNILASRFPLMTQIGSAPLELMERCLPLLIRAGEAGVVICFALTLLVPGSITTRRLAALGVAIVLTATNPGGYTTVFLLFFVFQERWRGPWMIMALVSAYLLCIPWDFLIVRLAHLMEDSYLTGRTVGYDLGITLGETLRPGLVLLIEYGLVGASLTDIARELQRRRRVPPTDYIAIAEPT